MRLLLLATSLVLSFLAIMVASQQPTARVLLYSATTGYRHDSIPVAIEALQTRGSSINVVFESTEDRSRFNDEALAEYDAIVFLSTTGEVLDREGQDALQSYLNKGGNFIGIHSASDTLRNASFFVREIGSKFHYHSDLQEAAFEVIGPTHPSTESLPSPWRVQDEVYNFESDPRSIGATVVLTVDESSYTDDDGPRRFNQGNPHPIAWYQERGAGIEDSGVGGRSFYTSLGHLNETWRDTAFMSHVLGGIRWVLQSNTTRAFNPDGLVGNTDSTLTPSEAPFETVTSSSATASRPTESADDLTATNAPDSGSSASRVGVLLVLGAAVVVANTLA